MFWNLPWPDLGHFIKQKLESASKFRCWAFSHPFYYCTVRLLSKVFVPSHRENRNPTKAVCLVLKRVEKIHSPLQKIRGLTFIVWTYSFLKKVVKVVSSVLSEWPLWCKVHRMVDGLTLQVYTIQVYSLSNKANYLFF